MTYATLAALTFIVGLILGRVTRRPVIRHSSSQYFLRRQEVWPVMARWNAEAVRRK